MGKKDRYEKVYTGNAEVFADIVNYLLYEGEEKIQPDDLCELDGEELLVEEKKVLQRLRDVVKQVDSSSERRSHLYDYRIREPDTGTLRHAGKNHGL